MSTGAKQTESGSNESIAARQVALRILLAVLRDGSSLSSLDAISASLEPRDAAFARMLSYGVLRYLVRLQAQLGLLMQKKLKSKDQDIELILLLALFQLQYTRVPDYAAVDVAVKQTRKCKKNWAGKLVNGVLRNFLRQHKTLDEKLTGTDADFAHPQWMLDRIREDWPQHWRQVVSGNNTQPPMSLRVNLSKISLDDYVLELQKAGFAFTSLKGMDACLILEAAVDVCQLPGFEMGYVSVQDAGAQLAAMLLDPQAGDAVLDACAAPGGKTAHLYERQPDITLTAVDIDEQRLQRVQENAERLGFKAALSVADATQLSECWSEPVFDCILLDVPCSASGVIRRHPDIKHLRREEDLQVLVELQQRILQSGWKLLKPGGRLLYATCSLFSCENELQVAAFLQQQPDATLLEMPVTFDDCGLLENIQRREAGIQLLPLTPVSDGFYYALLGKKGE